MPRQRWLAAGLFFTTFATLLLEILDARLLSVLTWYHLSFFAVSLAMLGMAAGAVLVFAGGARFEAGAAPRTLARTALVFAWLVPISHVVSISIPFFSIERGDAASILSGLVSIAALAAPFLCSGIVVTLALTRCGGRVGRLYAWDLFGAALACLVVVPMLERSNVSTAVFLSGAAAALGSACLARFAGTAPWWRAGLAMALAGVALANTGSREVIRVRYPKNHETRWSDASRIDRTAWNSHSYVSILKPIAARAFFWGPGRNAGRFHAELAWLIIDGDAGTPITRWNGDPAALDWVPHDVTTLPYRLRRGAAAVIGAGGGRDILGAIWGRNHSILGIDVNATMIAALSGSHREFAGIAGRPEVTLVHDDARSYLTRHPQTFDVLQMSLVDTWAATGAGAFTLSENGLYTREAWRVFLDHLTPTGVFSVSRWFDPANVTETSRLAALAVAALIDRGVASPRDHLLIVARERIATLVISPAPLTVQDRDALTTMIENDGVEILLSPWMATAADPRLEAIARSRSLAALDIATADSVFDFRPPTDAHPYYFNMLKPRAFWRAFELPKGGAIWGNLRATGTLMVLFLVAFVLVVAIIAWPLWKVGWPALPGGALVALLAYFSLIGTGFMLVQIGLVQRCSVYLGHPTYTLAIILFAMLLFTGVGSLLSERIRLGGGTPVRSLPLAIAAILALTALLLPQAMARTAQLDLLWRSALVVAFMAPLSMLLGCCFPIGARLVGATPALTAWMWGANGACSVLASIAAVVISLWVGIDANFWIAVGLYLALAWPLRTMRPR